jgi:tetratricopeptide (TPR) repeat protein
MQGNPEAALQSVKHGLELDPLDLNLWTTYGQILLQTKNYAAAGEAYSRLLELNQKDVSAAHMLAFVYYHQKRYGDAIAQANAGTAMPQSEAFTAKFEEVAALSYIRLGRCPEALIRLERVLETDPKNDRILKLVDFCRTKRQNPAPGAPGSATMK